MAIIGGNNNINNKVSKNTSYIDSTNVDLNDIIKEIDGAEAICTVFAQVKSIDDLSVGFDPVEDIYLNQYNKIENVKINLDSIPEATPDVETITLTAILDIGRIIYKGDLLEYDMLGGKVGIFVVTEVKKKSYNNHTVFSIECKLDFFKTDENDLYEKLLKRVVETLHYNEDYSFNKKNQVVDSKTRQNMIERKLLLPELSAYYIRMFRDNNNDGLITIDIDGIKIYDPNPVNFLRVVHGIETNTTYLAIETVPNVYDAIIKHDTTILSTVKNRCDLGPAGREHIYLDYDKLLRLTDKEKDIVSFKLDTDSEYIKGFNKDSNTYIFSKEFYQNGTCTGFEKELLKYINRDSIIMDEIIEKHIKHFRELTLLEQFYIIPIYILLLRIG